MKAVIVTNDNAVLEAPFVRRALSVARILHGRHTAPRREDGSPYFTHPLAVATLLAHVDYDDPCVLATAAGHDLLDTTPVSYARLRKALAGPSGRFARLAQETVDAIYGLSDEASLTQDEKAYAASLSPCEKRKWKNDRQIDGFRDLPECAKPGRLADIIHNAATLSNGTRELRDETHRKGKAIFDIKNWDGTVPAALLAVIFDMNIRGENNDLIGPYGVRAAEPFIEVISELVARARQKFDKYGYPSFDQDSLQAIREACASMGKPAAQPAALAL